MRNLQLSKERVVAKTTIQFEAVECGAASLRIILQYFGKIVPLSDIRKECGITRDGATASRIVSAAKSYGLDCRPFKLSAEGLCQEGKFPIIVFWGFNHFLVLEGFDEHQNAYLSDPQQGRVRVSFKEFEETFTGVALEFIPNKNFTQGGNEESNFAVLPELLNNVKPYVWIAVILSIFSAIPTLVIAGATSQIINQFLNNNKLYFGIPSLWLIGISSTILMIILTMQYLIVRRLGFKVSKELTADLFQKLFSVPFAFYQQRMLGELAQRMQLGVRISDQFFNDILLFTLTIIQSFVIVIATLLISWQLTVFCLLLISVNLILNYKLTLDRVDSNRLLGIEEGKMLGASMQGIGDIQMIKASGLEIQFMSGWQIHFSNVIEKRQELGIQIGLSNVVASGSTYLMNSMLIGIGGLLILSGDLTLGALVSFQFLLTVLVAPVAQMSGISKQFQMLDGLLGRILDLQKTETDTTQDDLLIEESNQYQSANSGPDNHKLFTASTEINVEFKDVDFSYDPKKPFIEKFNFVIPNGGHLALVGGSGCGKSTIIKVLAGLYNPLGGQIKFNGVDKTDIKKELINQVIGYVPQDVFMFNESIETNLKLWKDYVSDSDLESAVELACIKDMIDKYPLKYKQIISNGGLNISGGQRQRLEIARALALKPKLLLLDEATSALDEDTEKQVLENIWGLGISTVSIAHRMRSALMSDFVIVMHEGKIVEQDTPNNLLKTETVFKHLVNLENNQ